MPNKPYHVQMTLDGHIDLVDNVTGKEYDGWIDDSDPEPPRDDDGKGPFPAGNVLTEYGQARLEDGEPDHHPVDRRITVKYQMEFVVPDGEWFEYSRLSGYGDWLTDEARFDFGDWFTGLQAHTHTEGE